MTNDNPVSAPKNFSNLVDIANKSTTDVSNQQQSSSTVAKGKTIGQEEFLNLLVHQLQHQDPLDPMKSEEFASQLATFSQLEQLISINKKLDSSSVGGANTVTSMASFLGQEVVLKDQTAQVSAGKGPNLLVDLPANPQSLRIDLFGNDGVVIGSKSLDEISGGKQVINLDQLTVPDGAYGVRVVAVDSSGKFVDIPAKISGTVEGFIIDPEPKLLINGQEIGLDQIKEVHQGKQ